MGPDAREEIGLELEPDRKPVVFRFTDAAALSLPQVTDPEQVLDMMADLVGDDVGLGKMSGAPKRSWSMR